MNWEAVGAIGETVGAVGVNDIRVNLLSDPDVTAIYVNGLADIDSLSELERERFRLMMTNAMWALWNAYSQSQIGSQRSWEAQKRIVRRMLRQPGGIWYWESYRGEFDPDFQLEVDRVVASD